MADETIERDLTSVAAKTAEMRMGANWFFWIAILAVANSLLIYFFNFVTHLFGLGMSQYVDGRFAGDDTQRSAALVINIALAGMFALFGYFARKGSDIAFILGMFIYFFDAIILLTYGEFFAVAFHLFCLFFLFKGLLASRRRYDPSVDATGA
mgnify:FL=1